MSGRYSTVACCIDETAAAADAMGLARIVASASEARLLLVHVAPTPEAWLGGMEGWSEATLDVEEDIRQRAGQSLEAQATRIGAEAVLLQGGHAAEAVCAWATDQDCDLLVAAPHSGRLRRATIGSFAGYISLHAPCSVLLARGTLPAAAEV